MQNGVKSCVCWRKQAVSPGGKNDWWLKMFMVANSHGQAQNNSNICFKNKNNIYIYIFALQKYQVWRWESRSQTYSCDWCTHVTCTIFAVCGLRFAFLCDCERSTVVLLPRLHPCSSVLCPNYARWSIAASKIIYLARSPSKIVLRELLKYIVENLFSNDERWPIPPHYLVRTKESKGLSCTTKTHGYSIVFGLCN